MTRFAGHEVDLFLTVLHALHVLGESGHALFAVGRGEGRDVEQRLAVVGIGHQAFLERASELGPEGRVLLRLVRLHVLDGREDLLGQTTTDGSDLPVLLQNFTRDVEREVLCVDDTLDEAQVIGHQLFTVVHDEDALDVEVDAGLALTHEEIERRRRRNEQQRLVFESTFGLHRDDLESSSQAWLTCL